MLINDPSKKCTIYDKYFVDDLYPYKLEEDSSRLDIAYNVDDRVTKNQILFPKLDNKILSLIRESIPGDNKYEYDVWYPIFITVDTSDINNALLLRGSSVKNKNLGLENFVSFPPELQTWDISGSSETASLSIDWIINGLIVPYDIEYGILCWFKNATGDTETTIELPKDQSLTINKIPLHAIIKPESSFSYLNEEKISVEINTDTVLVKKSNNLLQILDNNNTKFNIETKTVDYIKSIRYFNIDAYLDKTVIKRDDETDDQYKIRRKNEFNNIKFKIFNTSGKPKQDKVVNLISSEPNLQLWISDGDSYSYFKSSGDKKEANKDKRASWTYISPTLYHVYREIYNILTIHRVKYINKPLLNRKQTRLLKKLAYYLSTGPILDRTTVNHLSNQEIQDIVSSYIDQDVTGIQDEIVLLKKTIAAISVKLKYLSNYSNNTLNNNIVTTKSQLFKKLLSKYGAHFEITNETTFRYKNELPHGPHFKLNQDIISKCNKNLSNTTVFNNIIINAGQSRVESLMSPENTSFSVRDLRSASSITIPIWDIEKKKLLVDKISISAGDDQIIRLYEDNENKTPINEAQFEPKNSIIPDYDQEFLNGDQVTILWEKISGSDCLKFSDYNFSGGPGSQFKRYDTSSDPDPTIYVKKPGRYVIQVTVTTSFGVAKDEFIVYVVNDKDEYEPNRSDPVLNTREIVELRPAAGLVVLCPNLREFALSKYGIFWPTYADAYVYSKESNPFGKISSFGDNIKKYAFQTGSSDTEKIKNDDPATLSITYKPENTIINISRIILKHMLDDNEDCYLCESFFKNYTNSGAFTVDLNDQFSLIDKDNNTIYFGWPTNVESHSYIKSYGGFSDSVINSGIGVKIPYHPAIGTNIPSVTGADMENPRDKDGKSYHRCYLQDIPVNNSIVFDKGVFHPFSGWIADPKSESELYKDYKEVLSNEEDNVSSNYLINKSSVIKFDPGRRKTLMFKGQGFFGLKHEFTENEPKPLLFRSQIILNTTSEAQECLGLKAGEEGCSQEELASDEKSEIDDHDVNFGYRNIGTNYGKDAVFSDEFQAHVNTVSDAGTLVDDYCLQDSEFFFYTGTNTYGMTRKGAYIPDDQRTPISRFTRSLNSAKIKDLEVEIDFVNYANPKDLIIWLDITTSDGHAKQIFRDSESKGPPRDRLYHIGDEKINNSSIDGMEYNDILTNINNIPDNLIKNYLLELLSMNDNPKTGALFPVDDPLTEEDESQEPFDTSGDGVPKSNTYRLYLLNQEHIEANRYNINLLFSDYANKSDHKTNNSTKFILPTQTKAIEKDNIIHLLPTTAVSGYSDYESKLFQNIIKTNNLELPNNRFIKYRNIDLFTEATANVNNGSTVFTLGIGIVGESDDMVIADRVVNQDSNLGLNTTELKSKSSVPNNSICCWNLILHIADDTTKFRPVDNFGYIDYNNFDPIIPGYSFIANFKNNKYLLPPVNLNAPNNFIYGTPNSVTCVYNREAKNYINSFPPPFDILPIIIVMPAASVTEATGQTISVDAQGDAIAREIVDYFNDLRRYEQQQLYNRAIYVPKYNKYPHGSAEKILLNISKDNHIWYKTEASIFKYINSHVMARNKYSFIRLHKDFMPNLSHFNYTIPISISDILDDNNIIDLYINIDTGDSIINQLDKQTLNNKLQELLDKQKSILDANKNNPNPLSELAIKTLTELSSSINNYKQTIDEIPFEGISIFNLFRLNNQDVSEQNGIYGALPPEDIETKADIFDYDDLILKLIQTTPTEQTNVTPTVTPTEQQDTENQSTDIRLDSYLTLLQNNDLFNKIFNFQQKKTIIIPGIRAFYFFDKNDTIPVLVSIQAEIEKYKKLENTEEVKRLENLAKTQKYIETSNTIEAKHYIYKNNQYYTIISFKEDILNTGSITKTKEESNIILLFDNSYSSSDGGPNKWSFLINNDDIISNTTPYVDNSTIGEDSYGTASSLVKPKKLSRTYTRNRVLNLKEKTNAKNLDRLHKTNVQIFDKENSKKIETMISTIGYPYSGDDIGYIVEQDFIIKTKLLDNDTDNSIVNNDLNNIMKNFMYHIIHQNKNHPLYIDLKSDTFKDSKMPDYGQIIINEDLSFNPPTYKFSVDETKQLSDRLNLLNQANTLDADIQIRCGSSTDQNQCINSYLQGLDIKALSISDLETYIQYIKADPLDCNTKDGFNTSKCLQKVAQNLLSKRYKERNNILYYMDLGGITKINRATPTPTPTPTTTSTENQSQNTTPLPTPTPSQTDEYQAYSGTKTLPYIIYTIIIDEEDGGSISFNESLNQDDYWINLDPEQGCSLAQDITSKILISAEYKCERQNNTVTLNAPHICSNFNNEKVPIDSPEADMGFDSETGYYTYRTPLNKIKEQIEKYGITLSWPELGNNITENPSIPPSNTYIVERQFFLNMLGEEKNQLVSVKETYLLPNIDKSQNSNPDGNVDNKLKNIYNLDETNELYVRVRNIPRKLKDHDRSFERYRPNKYGELTKDLIPAPGGANVGNFAVWQCIDKNTGKFIKPPDYYIAQNEMIFRGFFSSIDNAEHRGSAISDTKFPADWIPYDYK